MPDFTTRNRDRIKQAIEFLIAHGRPITVEIEGEQTPFDSMIVKVDHGDPLSKAGTAGRVFIEWLSPPRGNDLIVTATSVLVRFLLGKFKLVFTSYYITKSLEPPYLGHIITYPETLVIADRRKYDRREVGTKSAPFFPLANIHMRAGGSQQKLYKFKIFDLSEKGIGVLVGKESFKWLERIEIGERLQGVELSAPWTIVKVDGTVRHKSIMRKAKYSDYHLLGIEFAEKLEHYA